MNRTPQIGDAQEYRSSMQRAAFHFLKRHQAEHLTDDGKLFERGVQYLVNAMDVPAFMADRLVHLAMSELESIKPPVIGIDYATGDSTVVYLVNVATGESALVPARYLPMRLQPPAARLAAAAVN